ncbi:site-specific integrase [Rhizobium sp. L43]|uniref:site-specific integrase n=1 Tax=Rhizobium sp. L43 TaxID=2035452 RepID=UPI000BE8F564|nr:site-specific integrase [Rhizobium sp. L43]PDS79170.1 integrase [Rhizobium sp. L43]
MPRKSLGVRKYLRERAGRPAVWVILDGSNEVSTGCPAEDVAGADRALEQYLARRHKPDFRKGEPETVAVADVMLYYVEEHADSTKNPKLIGYHMLRLNPFFGGKMVSEVDAKACRDYRKLRQSGQIGPRPVQESTARRELETLQSALNFAYDEKKLLYPVKLNLGKKAPARVRYLSRTEVARLIGGALGYVPAYCDVVTRQPGGWCRMHRPQYHVARFILICLYTGTRHDATLKLRWQRTNSAGGWIDLDDEILYRKADGEAETNKRRPPLRIPLRLLNHLHIWRKQSISGPIEYNGEMIAKMKTGFNNARDRAGLGRDVVPHVLRHTCATWLLNAGETIWDVAGFLGTSEKVIRDTYGHHSTGSKEAAKSRFRGR